MREAILEELGLMPLWQLRRLSVAGTAAVMPDVGLETELTAVSVSREDGSAGWILLDEALTEDASALFANMLRAMRLRQIGTMQFAPVALSEATVASGVQWVWMMGDSVAQRVLETDLPVAALARQALSWQNLPVFVSAHPRELLLRPQDKSGIWADWCGWLVRI